MKFLYVMQGISGSGKTSWIQTMLPDTAKVFSADHAFVSEEGKFVFDGERLAKAHADCLLGALLAMTSGESIVVVDNTNLAIEDFAPYVAIGEALGYQVVIHRMRCSAKEARTSKVPLRTLYTQAHKLDRLVMPGRYTSYLRFHDLEVDRG